MKIQLLHINAGLDISEQLLERAQKLGYRPLEAEAFALHGRLLERKGVPALTASKAGRIILTSSITGPLTGYPGWAHYAASKAGQRGCQRGGGSVHMFMFAH